MYDKKILRRDMLTRRNNLSIFNIKERSIAVTEKISQLEIYKKADIIFTYLSMGSEVSTYELIRYIWELGKTAAIPAVIPNTRDMEFRVINSFDKLSKSSFGVFEPVGGDIVAPEGRNALFIVPGLVFDRNRNRIGYGGGFYDKYMNKYKDTPKIGVCFSFQVVPELLSTDEHDVPVDILITDTDIY